jgi:hypothetical protein
MRSAREFVKNIKVKQLSHHLQQSVAAVFDEEISKIILFYLHLIQTYKELIQKFNQLNTVFSKI